MKFKVRDCITRNCTNIKYISNERYIELLKVIAKDDRTPDFIDKLNVTKKDFEYCDGPAGASWNH